MSLEGLKLLKGHLSPELLLSLEWPSGLRKGHGGPKRLSLEWLELTKGHGGPEWLLGLEWPSRLKRGHRTPEKLSLEWPSRLRKGLHRPPIKALKASKLLDRKSVV